MAHPYQDHRQTKVEHSRVAQLTKGYANGGAVHGDEAEDKALIRKSVKKSALKVEGSGTKARADRPGRARGGRAPKKSAKTNVNVIVAGHGGQPAAPAMAPPPGPVPMAAPAMPPRPPMLPPGAGPGLPPGMPPGMPPGAPPGMPPRRSGGRTYAKGGAVKFGPSFEGSRHAGTQVQHTDGKKDGKDIGRPKAVTYKTGGPVEGPKVGGMGPKLPGGAGGGEARLTKEKRAAKSYAKA